MNRLAPLLLSLCWVTACGGEGDANETSGASTEATTGSGESGSSEAGSESSTGTGDADADTTTGDGDSGGDGDATTTSGDGDATTSGDGDATTSGDGDGEGCVDLAGVDFGPCDAIIGVGFVDGGCTYLSGCDCGDYCGDVFESMQACTEGCAALGECDSSAFLGYGLARDGWGEGSFCDDHIYCVPADAVPVLEAGIDGVMCGNTGGTICGPGHTECSFGVPGDTPTYLADLLCQVSLWHSPKPELYCAIYGG